MNPSGRWDESFCEIMDVVDVWHVFPTVVQKKGRNGIILQLGDINWLYPTPWPQASFQRPWRTITTRCSTVEQHVGWKPIRLRPQIYIFWCEVSDSRHTKEWFGQAHTVLGNPPMHDVSGVKPKPPELEYKFMWHWYVLDYFQSMCWPYRHFLSISHFLWIQSHPYHLFKL